MVTDDIIEEIARAWASIDGKAELFDRCKADKSSEAEFGHFDGYMAEARELVKRSPQLSAILSASPAPVALPERAPYEVLQVLGREYKTTGELWSAIRMAVPASPAPVAAGDWEAPETRARIIYRARQLWNEDQPGCGWSDENREHYIIRAAMEAGALAAPTPPAPTQPAAEPVAVSLLARWREGEFETTADETAQIALDDQAVGLDVAPIIEAWLTAVAAPAHVAADAQVRVKPLEWERRGADWYAETEVGQYAVGIVGAVYVTMLRGITDGSLNDLRLEEQPFGSVDAAKAAAQADYERRIRSALASERENKK